MPYDDLEHVVTCIKDNIDPDPTRLASCLRSSKVGSKLFEGLANRMHYQLYVKEIESQLTNLEHLGWGQTDVEAFDHLMRSEAANLTSFTFKEYQKNGPLSPSLLARRIPYCLAQMTNTFSGRVLGRKVAH